MTLPELMRRGWKGELPSDALLRENPAAYDSSPPSPVVPVPLKKKRKAKQPPIDPNAKKTMAVFRRWYPEIYSPQKPLD